MDHTLSLENMYCICVLLFELIFHPCDAHQEKHFLHYKFTVLTRTHTFPEFSAECVYDDRRIKHFSNEERVWILTDTATSSDPPDSRNWFIRQIRTLSNCTDSLCSDHVLQRIIGCELEKLPDGSVNLTVFDDYGFDGEDFISFNYDTGQWIDKNPKAKETKIKWDRHTERNQFIKHFLKNCVKWISTFDNTNKSSPAVHVSVSKSPADDSQLVLVCLATGFYPRDVQMNIRRNKYIAEDQTSSEIRPNDDKTFQMRISMKIDTNHEGFCDCLLTHSSLTEPVTVNWVGIVLTGKQSPNLPLIVVSVVLVLALVLAVVLALVLVLVMCIWGLCVVKSSKGKMSSNDDKSRKKMMKRTEHLPSLTGQMCSCDDENEVKIRFHSERGKMSSSDCVGLCRTRTRPAGTERDRWSVNRPFTQ
ncbi:H-2 class I histocompatibility antigen, K-K alpha chain-like [Siphateles boraxobius]|uniref:H-2 class I histocompatibility antigen, K-K alpha chain-like n=1 Tax=Siphateles boraxobius TaxID=180520 RepID=UPI004063ECDB